MNIKNTSQQTLDNGQHSACNRDRIVFPANDQETTVDLAETILSNCTILLRLL